MPMFTNDEIDRLMEISAEPLKERAYMAEARIAELEEWKKEANPIIQWVMRFSGHHSAALAAKALLTKSREGG